MWDGDYGYLLSNLMQKDFKIRYRNVSLGVFGSLLNPLILSGVLTFVFTALFPNWSTPHFAVFALCGLLPYIFFTLASVSGTSSLVENAGLTRWVPVPRETIPLASVPSNFLHLVIQIGLLLFFVLIFEYRPNIHWFWLPVLWGLEVAFLCGSAWITAPPPLMVYKRDTLYVVESANTLLFWLAPIFYDFSIVPQDLYSFNPVAALALILRTILLDGMSPSASLLLKLTLCTSLIFTAGLLIFGKLKRGPYDYL